MFNMLKLTSSYNPVKMLQMSKSQVAMGALTIAITILQYYGNRYTLGGKKKLGLNAVYIAALALASDALIKTKKMAFIPTLALVWEFYQHYRKALSSSSQHYSQVAPSPPAQKPPFSPISAAASARPSHVQTESLQDRVVYITLRDATTGNQITVPFPADSNGIITPDNLVSALRAGFCNQNIEKIGFYSESRKINMKDPLDSKLFQDKPLYYGLSVKRF